MSERANATISLRVTPAILAVAIYCATCTAPFATPACVNPLPDNPFSPANPYSPQWHHQNPGGNGTASVDADIDTPLAWKCTTGSQNIIVAIIEDQGTDLEHPDLKNNRFYNLDEVNGAALMDDADSNSLIDDITGWDFAKNMSLPPHAHGTAQNGVAVARPATTAKGVWGACPRCRFLPLRADMATTAKAIDYAREMKAQIISLPPLLELMTTGSSFASIHRQEIIDAIKKVTDAGGIVIIGAGNAPVDVSAGSLQALNNVIAVSSSNSRDAKAMGVPDSELDKFIEGNLGVEVDPVTHKTLGELGPTTVEIREAVRGKVPGSFNGAAIGNSVDLLAPSSHYDGCLVNGTYSPGSCAQGITTTDWTTELGLNLKGDPCKLIVLFPGRTDLPDVDYTRCFGGVSSSRALAAGAAGLVLSVRPDLSLSQVQRLLQDTADKIEPSIGQYDPASGFSSPWHYVDKDNKVRVDLPATHAWGRINVFEAVRIVAPFDSPAWNAEASRWKGGNGVDVFLRDNYLDWGNTEQPSATQFEPTADSQRPAIPYWESPDIKMDGPPFQAEVDSDSRNFEHFPDEATQWVKPESTNRVFVRVRNRGPDPASNVGVRLYWAWEGIGGALPLPGTFWSSVSSGARVNLFPWHPIPCSWKRSGVASYRCPVSTLPYSGASVAGCPDRTRPGCIPPHKNAGIVAPDEDLAWIASFRFHTPSLGGGQTKKIYLLAIVDSPQDPVGFVTTSNADPDYFTPRDNNVTLRRIAIKSGG